MRIGDLKHRIKLQHRTDTQDSFGQPIPTFTTYATVWSLIEPQSGTEVEVANQIKATVTHKVTMRYLADVRPTDRIVYGCRELHISAALNVQEKGEWLNITATEVIE